MHAAAVGHSVRPRRAGHPRHPLPRRLLSHRPVGERHDPRPAPRAVGHSSVRPSREPRQDGGAGPAPVLPRRPVGLGRTDRVLHSRARGGADHPAPHPPPPASHHATAHSLPDREAVLRSTSAARSSSFHAPHVGHPAAVQVQTTLSTRPHRPRLPGRCALLGPAASSLERQTAMARLSSQPIRLRHGRQPQRLRLLPRVHTYAAWQYGRLCGVAPTPPGRGNIQRQLLPRTRSPPPLAHSDRMVRALGGGCLRIHLRPVAGRSVHALLRRQHVRRPHHQPTGDSQQGTRQPAPPAVPHRLRAQHRHPRRAPPGSRQHAGRLPQPTGPAPSRPRRAVGRRSPVRLCSSVRCVPGV